MDTVPFDNSFQETFEGTMAYSDESISWLRQRIKELQNHSSTKIKQKVFAKTLVKVCGDRITEDTIYNFTGGRQALPEDAHRILVQYLWDSKLATDLSEREEAAQGPATLFHALSNFLDVSDQSLLNLSKEIPGNYTVWRPSIHIPGQFIKGLLKIDPVDLHRSIKTTETHLYKGGDDTTAIQEIFEGFIIKKSRHYVMLARQQGGHTGPPRFTIIHNTVSHNDGCNEKQIYIMEGMVTGCYGANSLYCAPIYIERANCSEEKLYEQLNISSSIPESIKSKLKFQLRDGVIRF